MNIPNALTIIRFILIPVFIHIFFQTKDGNILYGTYIFIIAGITDVLDGYIARKYDLVTKWGQVMDPLADKLMLITVLISFTIKEYLPIWVILIVGLKEVVMIIGGIFLYYRKDGAVVPSNKYGKIATVSFYIAILYLAIDLPYSIVPIIIAILITLLAFGNYYIKFRLIQKEKAN